MNASLDTWTLIFLVAALQGLLLAYLIYQQKSSQSNYLAWLEVAFSTLIFYYVLFWTGYLQHLPTYVNLLGGLVYVFGPLLLFHIQPELPGKPLHFLPLLVFCIYFFSLPFLPAATREFILPVQAMLQVIHLMTYGVVAWKCSKQNLRLQVLTGLFGGYSLTHLLYYLFVWTSILNPLYDYMISFAECSVMYFGGYMMLVQPNSFSSKDAPKYDKSKLSESAAEAILADIKKYMEIRKGYLNNDLKLHQLAEELSLSVNHISQVINELEGCNFPDFVNRYRIEEAKKLILDQTKAYKIIQIAYLSGFNNKATFNSAFKKFVGMQPTRYKESVAGENKGKRS